MSPIPTVAQCTHLYNCKRTHANKTHCHPEPELFQTSRNKKKEKKRKTKHTHNEAQTSSKQTPHLTITIQSTSTNLIQHYPLTTHKRRNAPPQKKNHRSQTRHPDHKNHKNASLSTQKPPISYEKTAQNS
jgi:hypothetical protein